MLSKEIDNLNIENRFKSSLKHNRHELLEAIRFLEECNIDDENFYKNNIKYEQNLLLNIYKNLINKYSDNFTIKEKADIDSLKESIKNIIK